MRAHILHVAYDRALLETRHLMLKARGYNVTSALGNEQVMAMTPDDLAGFQVAVIGFSSTHAARSTLVKWFKAQSPQLPVVVLQFHEYERFPLAECTTLSEEPALWLDAVDQQVSRS